MLKNEVDIENNNPKYSFILPTYNMQGKIEYCIESIQKQTGNFEIIIINDGSTDETKNIVEKYTMKDKRIKLFNFENRGVSFARNKGIQLANGKYIIFVDPDDRIKIGLLDALEEYTSKDIDLIRYGVEIINGNDIKPDSFYLTEISDYVLDGHQAIQKWTTNRQKYALPWIYCAKREIYINNGIVFPENLHSHEDFATIPILIAHAKTVKEIDFVGYEYIQNNNSIGHSPENLEDNIKNFIIAYDYVMNNLTNLLSADARIDWESIAKDLFDRLEVRIFHIKSKSIRDSFIKELGLRYKNISYPLNLGFSPINVEELIFNSCIQESYNEEMIKLQKLGTLIYGENILGVHELKKIKSLKHGVEHNYIVFSNIDYDRLNIDLNYRNFVLNILLSDTNLLMARKYFCSYIGEAVFDSSKHEYTAQFNETSFSLTKKYNR